MFSRNICYCTAKFCLPSNPSNSIRNASDNDTEVNNKNVVNETAEQSMSWELLVDNSKLSPKDLKIHRKHAEAVRVGIV